jgi:hypothetical protein
MTGKQMPGAQQLLRREPAQRADFVTTQGDRSQESESRIACE